MKTFLKFLAIVSCFVAGKIPAKDINLLNVSYDATREFYQEINVAFLRDWQKKNQETVVVQQSHGGSGKQVRAVIDGLEADVVTLALAPDIDALHEHGDLIPKNWQQRLPDNSSPNTSTIVFLVKKDNPKKIKDWDDLVRSGVKIITSDPQTSGGARWIYLAAYGYALKKDNGNEAAARKYIEQFYKNVPVLGTGGRAATTTFVQQKIGDVLVAWESEALFALYKLAQGKFEIVYPSVSILAEPPVGVVDKVVDRHGTRKLAEAYLQFLYTPDAQDIAARHFFRPRLPAIAQKHEKNYPAIKLFTVDEVFGGWARAEKIHFADGGIFDQISKANR